MSVSLPWTQRGRRASLSRGPTQTKLSGLWQASRSATLAQNDLAFSAVSVQLPLLSTEISSSVHASKAFVRGTAHASTHNGIKLVSNERRKNLLATVEDGVQYAETFKAACKRKYGNMCRAWRILLNPGGNGRVSFVPFCNAARSMGFVNVSTRPGSTVARASTASCGAWGDERAQGERGTRGTPTGFPMLGSSFF